MPDNVAPMLDELPDPDEGGDEHDPDSADTEREADMGGRRDEGAEENKVSERGNLEPGEEHAAEDDPGVGPTSDNGGVNDGDGHPDDRA